MINEKKARTELNRLIRNEISRDAVITVRAVSPHEIYCLLSLFNIYLAPEKAAPKMPALLIDAWQCQVGDLSLTSAFRPKRPDIRKRI